MERELTSQPWVPDAQADYFGAVIRLATFLHERVQRVVFAWVELYPHEVEVPPGVQEEKRLGRFTLRYSVTPVDLAEALDWYSDAAAGSITIPKVPGVKVESVRLAPEPAQGRLVVGADVPFEPSWHGGARLHRLVNMIDAETSVGPIAVPGDDPQRWETARAWLADRLQFDVLVSDDWIGGCALLAPNPRSRGLRHQPLGRTATGGSAFRLTADLRTGVQPDDLSIRLVERRLDGWSHTSTHPLDAFGSAEVDLPEPVDQIGYDLFDGRLGLLDHHPPGPIIEVMFASMSVGSGTVSVDVPSPKPTGKSTNYKRDITEAAGTTTVGTPTSREGLRRLRELAWRRTRRTGSARPGGQTGMEDTHVFHADRDAAADTIRAILKGAKARVVFVDPYFDEVSLREFALAIPERTASIGVLTDYRPERRAEGSPAAMQRLHDDLVAVTRLFREKALGSLDVRVSRGAVRRYHDRFLVVDDDVWHCGHSFNQVGRGLVTAMTRLRRPETVRAMIEEDLAAATPFASVHSGWLAEQRPTRTTWRTAIAAWLRGKADRVDERP